MIEKLADGKYKMPAGYDHHNHPIGFAPYAGALDIEGFMDKTRIMEMINEVGENLETDFLLVKGWNNARIQIDQSDLNQFAFPIILINVSYHGLILNKKAESIFMLSDGEVKGYQGNGVYVEGAAELIKVGIARDSTTIELGLRLIQDQFLSRGITQADDLYVRTPEQLQVYVKMLVNRELKLKIPNLFATLDLIKALARERPDLLKYIDGLKIILDGAFGMHTAALFEPYTDQPRNFGLELKSVPEIAEIIKEARKKGVWGVALHCIGDKAINNALAACVALRNHDVDVRGIRLEHAELITKHQASMAAHMGLVICLQPNFRSDCFDYQIRLGQRVLRINPFRILIDLGFVPGKNLFLGSDGMPTGLLHGLQCAVQGYSPAQSLTREEALAGYLTSEEGDYVIVSGDPFTEGSKVLETYVGGQLVYKAD